MSLAIDHIYIYSIGDKMDFYPINLCIYAIHMVVYSYLLTLLSSTLQFSTILLQFFKEMEKWDFSLQGEKRFVTACWEFANSING